MGCDDLNLLFGHNQTLMNKDKDVFAQLVKFMQPYVKYNRFHIEQRPRFKPNPFHADSLHYNEKEDYYVCPVGQHMTRIGTKIRTTASGYKGEFALYRAQNCKGCPLRGMCYKSKTDRRTLEVNHRLNQYKKKARELLTSDQGLQHRGRRCIEPEAVFGQMKYNMEYKRFRHFGKDKVTMDFAFFAIAFNLKKMCRKIAKQANNGGIIHKMTCFCIFSQIYRLRIEYPGKSCKNQPPENHQILRRLLFHRGVSSLILTHPPKTLA